MLQKQKSNNSLKKTDNTDQKKIMDRKKQVTKKNELKQYDDKNNIIAMKNKRVVPLNGKNEVVAMK